jgi:hypothetical protein
MESHLIQIDSSRFGKVFGNLFEETNSLSFDRLNQEVESDPGRDHLKFY